MDSLKRYLTAFKEWYNTPVTVNKGQLYIDLPILLAVLVAL